MAKKSTPKTAPKSAQTTAKAKSTAKKAGGAVAKKSPNKSKSAGQKTTSQAAAKKLAGKKLAGKKPAEAGSHKAAAKKTSVKGAGASSSASRVQRLSSTKPASKLRFTLEKVAESVASLFSSGPTTIAKAIKMDHEGLRNYLGILKDTDRDMGERRRAYAQFSVLLKSHSAAEEKALYTAAMKITDREIQIKTSEGYVEHQLADDLMARIEAATEPMVWSAHANVLSEILEHHLDEEERDLLSSINKEVSPELDREILEQYLKLRAASQKVTTPKNAGALA